MAKTANIEDLKNEDVGKLLWRYAIPAIVGSTVNALYNIIDRLFIGNAPDLGDNAISAIGIALPVMTIISAFGMLIGAGSASRISISMGEGNKAKAEKILGNAFLLSLVLTLPVSFLLVFFIDDVIRISGATGQTFEYTKEFLVYFLPGSIFSTMCFGFNNMMRASGYPQKAMYTMLISVIFNIILAPIFIFVLKWGLKGAAIATVISMFIGLCFVMRHFLTPSSSIRLRRANIKWDPEIIKSIVSIGLSPFFIQLTVSTVAFIVIHQLQRYGGDVAVGAYTISNTLVTLLIMVIIGLTQGMQPIVGFNYGAGDMKRVRDTLIQTIKGGVCIGIVGFLVGIFLPEIVVLPFNPSDKLAHESSRALIFMSMMLPLVGFQIVVTNFFQSIGKVGYSIFLSLSRQVMLLIPCLFILPTFFQLDGVWGAMPVSDFLATLITLGVFMWQLRKFKKLEESNSIL